MQPVTYYRRPNQQRANYSFLTESCFVSYQRRLQRGCHSCVFPGSKVLFGLARAPFFVRTSGRPHGVPGGRRHVVANRKRRGFGKPETFAFLGLVFICGHSRRGTFQLQRKTRRDRVRAKLGEI
jgi:hypothetical protein